MKKHWLKSVLDLLFLVGLGSWIYLFPYQKHVAQKATDQYLKEQKVPKSAIESREIGRDWKRGGYVTTIKYKKEPALTYEYKYHKRYIKAGYPYGVLLIFFKYGSEVEDNQVKYPRLPEKPQK